MVFALHLAENKEAALSAVNETLSVAENFLSEREMNQLREELGNVVNTVPLPQSLGVEENQDGNAWTNLNDIRVFF